MGLSANAKRLERFAPGEFAYPAATGVHLYAGALVALTTGGTLVPVGNAAAAAFAGLADGERDNTLGTNTQPVRVRRGTWALPVPSATTAQVGQTVYAVDDTTLALSSLTASAAAKAGGNTGNGTFTVAPTPGAGAMAGAYVLTMTAATAFSLVGPDGESLPAGATGTAYAGRALNFTLAAGATPFVAGDAFTITVAQASGAIAIGVLAGIEGGQTYVRLA